jgi:hypothetical protein
MGTAVAGGNSTQCKALFCRKCATRRFQGWFVTPNGRSTLHANFLHGVTAENNERIHDGCCQQLSWKAVDNQFKDEFSAAIGKMTRELGVIGTDVVAETRSLEEHFRKALTRKGLDIICRDHWNARHSSKERQAPFQQMKSLRPILPRNCKDICLICKLCHS